MSIKCNLTKCRFKSINIASHRSCLSIFFHRYSTIIFCMSSSYRQEKREKNCQRCKNLFFCSLLLLSSLLFRLNKLVFIVHIIIAVISCHANFCAALTHTKLTLQTSIFALDICVCVLTFIASIKGVGHRWCVLFSIHLPVFYCPHASVPTIFIFHHSSTFIPF